MVEKSNTELHKLLKKHPAAKEFEFLFDCCRAYFANTTVSYPDDIDAGVFYDLLQHHKLITHLYPLLKDKCDGVSGELLQRAQQALKQNKLHLLRLSGELVRLSKLFEEKQIPWLSIKGPALSMQLYGDVAARQSGDLDILVNEVDLEKSVSLLNEIGYNQISCLNVKHKNRYRRHHKDYLFRHTKHHILIELHWKLSHDWLTSDDITALIWTDTTKIQIAGEQIPIPNTTNHLIFLYEHGSRHTWYRIAWLWDIAYAEITRFGDEINYSNFSKELFYCFITANRLCQDIFNIYHSTLINNYSKHKLRLLVNLAKKALLYPENTKTIKMTVLRFKYTILIQTGFVRKIKSFKRYLI